MYYDSNGAYHPGERYSLEEEYYRKLEDQERRKEEVDRLWNYLNPSIPIYRRID